MQERKEFRWASQLIVIAVFAVLGLALLYGAIVFVEPPERTQRQPFRQDYSDRPLLQSLATNAFDRRLAAINDIGSAPGEREVGRLSGSPGFYRTEAMIIDTFREAGLTVQTQEFEVVVPVTEYCELLDEHGHPLEGVRIYPFMPAGLQPTALPKEGITARLVAADSAALKYLAGHPPSNTIVVTYLDTASQWMTLASAGVRALIVREDEFVNKLKATPDDRGAWQDVASNADVDFPRFLARGPIDKYAGQRVTLRCKVTLQTKRVRNILGILRGTTPSKEALVLSAFYDSSSIVPDIAPGAEQAVSLAALLEYAQALSLYRGALTRDIIFVATAGHAQALAGACRIMEAIEDYSQKQPEYQPFENRKKDQDRLRGYAVRAQQVISEMEAARTTPGTAFTRERWMREDAAFRTWFEAAFSTVAGEINLDFREAALQAKLIHQRAGGPVFREGFDLLHATDAERKSDANTHPLMRAYLDARKLDNRSANLMSVPLWEVLQREEFTQWAYADKARRKFRELEAYHTQRGREIDGLIGVRQLFSQYERTLTVNLELYSGGSRQKRDLSVLVGVARPGTAVEPQVTELSNAIRDSVPLSSAGEAEWKVISWGLLDAAGSIEKPNRNSSWNVELESEPWFLCGRLAFTVVNYEFFPAKVCTPEDTFGGMPMDVLHSQVPVLGRTLLAMGFGRVSFKTLRTNAQAYSLHGTIYTSAGSAALVPTHRVSGRTFVHAFQDGRSAFLPITTRGVALYPVMPVNPYGEYERPIAFDFKWNPLSVNAARFDDDGRVVYFKDASPASQATFRNVSFPNNEILVGNGQPPKPINVCVFRCSPVTLYDQGNPKTLKSFSQVVYMNRQGLSKPPRFFHGQYTDYMAPDFQFIIGFMDGAFGNKEILDYRAFTLNVDPDAPIGKEEPELGGRGYLVADTPVLTIPAIDAAASMLRTGDKRLVLQQRYAMADEQMLSFHERAKEWLKESRDRLSSNDVAQAVVASGTSLAYAINNHPVIRDRISQAIVGILWYLGLLVPFVFFAEKLMFGFTDIRKQLLANGIIFIIVFALLRLFHPAFEMVRSSLVILMGFIILLLTLLVTMMVGGKFKQNIQDLRSKEGRVEGADINRAGVVGTAFMLGLNNMRRRKVRTGLTCLTLVLITFVMICFTSVSSDLVNVEYATGRSVWNGIMLRNPNYVPITDPEVANIKRIYGDRFPITTWQWVVPRMSVWGGGEAAANPEILLDREYMMGDVKNSRRAKVNGCVKMEWNEPQFTGIDRCLKTKRGWFPRPPETRAEKLAAAREGYQEKNYVILPDTAAADIGLTAADVDNGHPTVTIRGDEYEVLGILDTVNLAKIQGLDGQSIMPFDLNSVQAMGSKGGVLVVPDDAGHLNPQQVMIVNRLPAFKGVEQALTVTCSILFPKENYKITSDAAEQPAVNYKEQRRTVLEYLERIGEPAYYAIDGMAYYGSRLRSTTFAGLLELLVPILIAALTVFNTMRGSVYERKDEIYVYNAVGVAPNHVFFIFMAEACVYAVVGAMMGYLLSQGTGRLLTALNLTGGMNMDYSSMATIYASLAIMLATLLSTIVPARDAARMASPADTVSWSMPVAQGDVMQFNLPFTFTSHDRVAVVSYFTRWLDSNGEGSSGPFYCSPPEATLRAETDGKTGPEIVPVVTSTIWLKPYDLGVSQRMEISLPTDPETGEYVARIKITRLSGHVVTWNRTVKPFLGILRKQFLNWRVATVQERSEMFAEAKQLLAPLAAKLDGKETEYVG